jgi:hypothetical protein
MARQRTATPGPEPAPIPVEPKATDGNGSAEPVDLGMVEGGPISGEVDMSALATEGSGELLKPQALGLNVSVSRPRPTARFRTHPDSRYWPVAYAVEIEVPGAFEKISLIVAPNFVHCFGGDARRRRFALYYTADSNLRFWPYAVDETGEPDGAHAESIYTVCLHARDQWVTTKWRNGEGYRAYAATVGSEPKWPDKPPLELLRLAHKGRLVLSEEHPRLQEYLNRKPL